VNPLTGTISGYSLQTSRVFCGGDERIYMMRSQGKLVTLI